MPSVRQLRRKCKYILVVVTLVLTFVTYHFWDKPDTGAREKVKPPSLTVIFQEFNPEDNDISMSLTNIAGKFPEVNVLVISQKLPYPSFTLPRLANIEVLVLENDSGKLLNISNDIKTDFVMFLPDGAFIDDHFLPAFINLMGRFYGQTTQIYAVPLKLSGLSCYLIDFSFQTWTLKIGNALPSTKMCDFVYGPHGILLHSSHLSQISNPFLPATFMSLYIQFSIVKIKAVILDELYIRMKETSVKIPQQIWRQKQFNQARLTDLYKNLGIKHVIRANGPEEWYGCRKDSLRCFGTVENDMPEYLHQGRWTPPCCLKHLRETARHVFNILDSCKVRYWLEGGSLLGAARNQDIIPWDYDIDVGIYKEDILKCDPLLTLSKGSFVDEDGFLWEKAIEGDFFRVQYSESNHLHVDIFPFYSRDGIMTKDTWFKSHRQDTEFPEHYLNPLTKIKFAGMEVSAPNRIREFLEYKFGKGVIENPKYPNAVVV